MLVRAGLRGFSMHSLRHTHATTLLRRGFNVLDVSKRLGHGDPGFTLRVYGWALPGGDEALADGIALAMDRPVAKGGVELALAA